MFSVYIFFLPNHEYNNLESAIYAPLHRIAWCFAIGWILLLCITDNARNNLPSTRFSFRNSNCNFFVALINGCLSLKIFSPLSKLTYCAYLVNGIIELHSYGTLRVPVYMSTYSLVKKNKPTMFILF